MFRNANQFIQAVLALQVYQICS